MKLINKINNYLYKNYFFELLFISKHFRKKIGLEAQTKDINYYLDPNKKYVSDLISNLDYESIEVLLNAFKYLTYCVSSDRLNKIDRYFTKKDLDLYKDLNQKRVLYKNQFDIDLLYEVLKTGLHYFDRRELKKRIRNTCLLDCGGFIGDSSLVFSKEFSELDSIYSFEPDKNNYDLMKKNIRKWKLQNVTPVNYGISDRRKTIGFRSDTVSSKIDSTSTNRIKLLSIDEFVKANRIKVGVIKMDIEGEEINALAGAVKTIKKFKPILLISIYHNGKDFFEIKPIIEKLSHDYTFKIIKLTPISPIAEIILVAY